MAAPGFYNQNSNRAFPFILGTVSLPESGPVSLLNLDNECVVDVGFMLGAQSGFDATEHSVYLKSIRRVGDSFFFDFASDAPSLSDVLLTFTRTADDENNLLEYVDSGDVGLSDSVSDSNGVVDERCNEPLWSGYLVSGKMATLALLLPTNGTVSRSDDAAMVEPALLQNLAGGYVTKIALGNDDRTRIAAADDCPEVVYPYPTDIVHVNTECLVGDIVLKAGYNAAVRQSVQSNLLIISAAVGSGEGEPCEQVRLFDNETPPTGSTLLEGGLTCNQTVRSINGIGGRLFTIRAGTGVTIRAVPEENKLVVDVNMSGLALCFSELSEVSESV